MTCSVQAGEPETRNHEQGALKAKFVSVKGLHSEVFERAKIMKVDPLRCISISELRTRPLCRWGIRMIKDTLLGRSAADTFIQDFVSTGKFPVIVEIPDEFLQLVETHFMKNGKSQEEATVLVRSGPWYDVVDRGNIHEAIVQAIREFSENFGGFRFPAILILWQPKNTIRSISGMCNEMQKESHIIDFTLPDAMQNLRSIIDAHNKSTGVALVPGKKFRNGFIKEVMGIYAGRPGYADNTMRIVCGMVLKVSSQVVSDMTKLLTEECDDYWQRLGNNKPFRKDTRVYKKLISSQSLKGANSFLTRSAMLDEDRIYVIHRLRFIAREQECFKAFQATEIENQCQRVINARTEVINFENFLDQDSWPIDMENLRHNIFQTTLLDEEVMEHTAAGKHLLPAIADAYIKATGAHGRQRIELHHRRLSGETYDSVEETAARTHNPANGNDQNKGNGEQDVNALDGDHDAEDQALEGTAEVTDGDALDPSEEKEEDPHAVLDNFGVKILQMSVTELERNSVDLEGTFDFVIADPFQKVPIEGNQDVEHQGQVDELVDEKGITIYLQCLRRLLVPGGYGFIFLGWDRLQSWTTCCVASQLEVTSDPFLVMKDPNRIQKTKLRGLQTIYDISIVIKRPERHPDGFKIDNKSPYVHLPACKIPRWCNVIDGIPPPAQRLTFKPSRAHVRPNERPCALIIEILQMFCPDKGKVLDASAGPLTTGLSCVDADRPCVLLETDDRWLSFALPRLLDFAKSKVKETDAGRERRKETDGLEQETGIEEREAEDRDRVDDNEVSSMTKSPGGATANSDNDQAEQSAASNDGQTPPRVSSIPEEE